MLSQALNTTGLYNDYTFRSMLQAQEIRLRSPDRLSPRGVWSGHETMLYIAHERYPTNQFWFCSLVAMNIGELITCSC